jgi:hypothetical protein
MINLSLPMTEGDIKAFVGEVRHYLTRNADMLPAGSPDSREFS